MYWGWLMGGASGWMTHQEMYIGRMTLLLPLLSSPPSPPFFSFVLHGYSYPPFFDEHPFRIYEKILEAKIEWPRTLDPNAKDLIKKLLVRDVTKRLGSLRVRGEGEGRGRGMCVCV